MEHLITLLNDGDTYSNLEGTTVAVVDDAGLDALQSEEDARFLMQYDLSNPVHLRLLADRIEKSRR